MVSLFSIIGIAAVFAGLAALVAFLRGLSLRSAIKDAVASLLGALAAITTACLLYALYYSPDSSGLWRTLGSITLTVSPIAATVGLRMRGQRSIWRAFIVSSIALVVVVVWLTIHLTGIRGGWGFIEIVTVAGTATVAVGSAACLGWWSKRVKPSRVITSGLVLLFLVLLGCTRHDPALGTLDLTITDASSNRLTPARVELLAADGRPIIPDNTLHVFGDCGSVPVHNWIPWFAWIQPLLSGHGNVWNPYKGTDQFYIDGSISAELPPGRYTVTVTKGIEFKVMRANVVVVEGATERLNLDLIRWIDLPQQGWYSADDHLHIPRPHPRFDSLIATWMQAEDIHVANLLQMGLARDIHITPQHGFGPESVYQVENTLVATGQENPRTHVLGHSIILGAQQWIDFPQAYILYDRFWRKAQNQGAVNGYAHWGLAGAEEGLAVWGHEELLKFIEVLSFGLPFYDRWYEAMNLGFRIGPTAGTDYPCLPSLPGRERFYAKLEGPLEYEAWLEAVRQGRTFVSNGPAIELTVDNVEVGGERLLSSPATVRIVGTVRFDPERDAVTSLELIRAGDVVFRNEKLSEPGLLEIDTSVNIGESTWFALRALGEKVGETEINPRESLQSMLTLKRRTNESLVRSLPSGQVKRPSAAHTAAIWVTVDGTPPIAEQLKAQLVIQAWLQRLDELQDRFRNERIDEMAGFPGRGDGIGEQELLATREALLDAIDEARIYYTNLAER